MYWVECSIVLGVKLGVLFCPLCIIYSLNSLCHYTAKKQTMPSQQSTRLNSLFPGAQKGGWKENWYKDKGVSWIIFSLVIIILEVWVKFYITSHFISQLAEQETVGLVQGNRTLAVAFLWKLFIISGELVFTLNHLRHH